MNFLLIILASLIGANCQRDEYSPIVATKSGPVRGKLIRLDNSTLEVYQFTAIPFAQPPIGLRRYRRPTPVRPWQSVYDATKNANACPQVEDRANFAELLTAPDFGSEDCLYLSIWVPKWVLDGLSTSSPQLLSTYIFIHGGAFISGSADLYNGTIFAAFNDVIVASIQYRLGSLGFAYLGGTLEMPGNMGLWDQLEAIKWLNKNIEFFGGNKSEVTIGGQSAGSASVTFHLLSPHSRPYFQRAIIESGAAIAPWAVHTKQQAEQVTNVMFQQLATTICNQTGAMPESPNLGQKMKCLKSANFTIFPRADLAPSLTGFGIPFTPVIDGAFLPRDPYEMLRSGDFSKVPILVGSTKDEGSVYLAMSPMAIALLPTPSNPNRTIDESLNVTHYRAILEDVWNVFLSGVEPSNPLGIESVLLHYWPRNWNQLGYPNGLEIVNALSNIVGDNALLCPTYAWAEESANFSTNVYAYYFTYRRLGEIALPWMGVPHSAELPFVFGQPFAPNSESFGFNDEDASLSLALMDYWANFIKYGDPNGAVIENSNQQLQKWPGFIGDNCQGGTLEIGHGFIQSNDESVICGLKAGDCMFWQDFYPKLQRLITRG